MPARNGVGFTRHVVPVTCRARKYNFYFIIDPPGLITSVNTETDSYTYSLTRCLMAMSQTRVRPEVSRLR